MKKALCMIVLSLILFTSFKPTLASETDVPYSGYAERSDYDRIEKIDGLWYGVITASETRLFAVNNSIDSPFLVDYTAIDSYHYFMEFKLTRATQYLKTITIEFEVDSYCPYITCLFGGREDSYSGVRTFTYDDSNTGLDGATSLEDAFGEGNITRSIDGDYDYVVNLDHTTKNKAVDSRVKILEFTYVLTDAEVQDLMLDIQAQYEQEYYLIITNPFLTASEKQNAINILNQEYSEYDVNFGEEMTSPCIGEDCEDEFDGAPELPDIGVIFDIVKFIEEHSPKGADLIAYIITILIIGYITGTIIFKGTQKILYTILDGLFSGITNIIITLLKVIWYYIDAMFSALGTILGSILNGFTK